MSSNAFMIPFAEGNATTTSFTKGGGAAFAGSETGAQGDSVASALSLQGGASRAEAKSKDGNAMATAIQGGDKPDMEDPFDDPFFKSNNRNGRKRRMVEQLSSETSELDFVSFSKIEDDGKEGSGPVITITIDEQGHEETNPLGPKNIPSIIRALTGNGHAITKSGNQMCKMKSLKGQVKFSSL